MTDRAPDTAVPVSTRPYTPDDAPFVFALYATTRAGEMALVDWDDAQKEQFLRMQFQAQKQHYTSAFPAARHDIILFNGEAVGRIYVDRNPHEVRLIDIVLLPAYRNRGIGAFFMEQLKQDARTAGVPVRLFVWQPNEAAQRFYRRHGFEDVGQQGAYVLMEWQPTAVV